MRTFAVVCLAFAACSSSPSLEPIPGAMGFDDARSTLGWKFDSTGGTGPLATWEARADVLAISPPAVMALVRPNHESEDRFNLCWTDTVGFGNGRLTVCVRADSGEVDRGGGPMWRVRDASNYYVCRYNPLESNFRLYVVTGGVRRQLASALVEGDPAAWHRIDVEHTGTKIVCTLDGRARLEVEDRTILSPGGIGLWTKADACTSFDDFAVQRQDR